MAKHRVVKSSIDDHYNLVHKFANEDGQNREGNNPSVVKDNEQRRQSARFFYTSQQASRRNSTKRLSESSHKSRTTWNESANNDVDEFGRPSLAKTMKNTKPKTPSLISDMRVSQTQSIRHSRNNSRVATTRGNSHNSFNKVEV